eukprot:scpid72968/ scgid5623/ Monoacylglycerol lipase ABHD12; 2-arachidonoylglycerol hydrolase; Abhydrolase domain-containing protein 12
MRQRGIASGKGSPQARGSRGQKKLIAKGDHQYGKDNFFLSCGLPSRLWLLLAVALYVLTPLFISYSSNAQRALTYLNYAAPPFSNLSDISSYLGPDHSGRAFFVNASQSGQIGTWHVYPKGEEVPSLSNGKPVVVYFHGNAGNRGLRHRVGLYKLLANLDYHIIAVDYRGFGDSSAIWPTNETVVSDAFDVYQWVRQQATGPIFTWGHSLGTGVSVQAASRLCAQGTCPQGVVLESAFMSIESAATTHPLGRPWSWILRFYPSIADLFFQQWTEQLNSLATITSVNSPLLLVHSKDDFYISYKESERLASHAQEHRSDRSTVELHLLEGHGHNRIVYAESLPALVQNFVTTRGKPPK